MQRLGGAHERVKQPAHLVMAHGGPLPSRHRATAAQPFPDRLALRTARGDSLRPMLPGESAGTPKLSVYLSIYLSIYS